MTQVVSLENPFFTDKQVAERYGVSTDSFWLWKRQGNFPAPVHVGPNCTRWRMADLLDHERHRQACFAMSLDAGCAA